MQLLLGGSVDILPQDVVIVAISTNCPFSLFYFFGMDIKLLQQLADWLVFSIKTNGKIHILNKIGADHNAT